MKNILLAGFLLFTNALAEQFKEAAFLELPLPDERVDEFLNGQALILKSKNVLEECVQNLALTHRWNVNEAEAIKSLAQKTTASREPNTNFIRVEVVGEAREETEKLLWGVLKASRTYFIRNKLKEKEEYLQVLNLELQKQGDLVQDYRKTMTVLTQQYGVPYFDNQGNQIGRSEMANYQQAQKKLAELKQLKISMAVQIREFLKTSNEDLIRLAAGLDLPNNHISKHFQAYLTTAQKVDTLRSSGLGADHPEVAALSQKMKQSLDIAGKEVVNVKRILEIKLSQIEKEIGATEQEVRTLKDTCVDLSLKQQQYNTAVRDYEQARALYSKMSKQQQELRVELKMPPAPIYIHRIP